VGTCSHPSATASADGPVERGYIHRASPQLKLVLLWGGRQPGPWTRGSPALEAAND